MARRSMWRGLALLAGFGLAAGAQDWPQWRGPNRDGVAPDAKLPDAWPKELRPLWRAEVGEGYSGPAIVDGKVVVLARQEEEEIILCLNAADGKAVWRDSYEAPYTVSPPAREHGKGPRATPVVAGGRVYTHGVSGIVSCLDFATGKVIWRRKHLSFGAASLLLEGKLLIHGIMWMDGEELRGAVVGMDKDSGRPFWQQTADVPAYGSPIVAELAGRRQIITLTQHKLIAVSPATGELLWETPFAVYNEMNILTPVVARDLAIISGYELGTRAFRITEANGKLAAEPVWQNEGAAMFISSPVVQGGHLYGLARIRGGSIVCLSLADGQRVWSSRGNLGEYASFIRAGDKLLVLTGKGELLVVAADPSEYRELARIRVTDDPSWAHLALAGNRLYVKDKTHLTCFELAEK